MPLFKHTGVSHKPAVFWPPVRTLLSHPCAPNSKRCTTNLRNGGATPSGGGATPGWPSPAATRPGRETRRRASSSQQRRGRAPTTARADHTMAGRRRTGGSQWRPPSPSCTPRWPCTPTVSGLPLPTDRPVSSDK
ncbi:hypothetical protein PAHAL_2G026000 [Panicum hallii]|uniref:Uncharacterized protein n=1 Tax=Panicum hallii TaxID=206008 RepID=A0A2S3GVK6_9POAL|nr:hypothetical protein PAHAL_2G026000 [Panicum hallii]